MPEIRTAFGLTCNIERTDTPSGFRPARVHPPTGEELFGEARIAGFAALLRTGYAHELVLLGSQEIDADFHQSFAIREILIKEHGADGSRIQALESGYGTAEAVDYVAHAASRNNAVVVSSFYHLPRIYELLLSKQIYFVKCMAAEVFLFMEGKAPEEVAQVLLQMLGGSTYAKRVVAESIGIERINVKAYAPRGGK